MLTSQYHTVRMPSGRFQDLSPCLLNWSAKKNFLPPLFLKDTGNTYTAKQNRPDFNSTNTTLDISLLIYVLGCQLEVGQNKLELTQKLYCTNGQLSDKEDGSERIKLEFQVRPVYQFGMEHIRLEHVIRTEFQSDQHELLVHNRVCIIPAVRVDAQLANLWRVGL
ncbi:hypothetical protein F511_10877 [Dorcoceras hygrometricum]|uniref:Uncharacterized protein n=1 Tax=Dorcoceras hygrometricum TaxID=472368 RepID=A0A2Z7C017_9LAMI|nr:hypothetical protein F511_10877 [Dorcoceras hygrometricum]